MKSRLILVVLCIVMGITYAVSSLASAFTGHEQASSSGTAVVALPQEVQDVLGKKLLAYLAEDTDRRQWRLISQEVTCVSSETTDTYYSATYSVLRVHTLKSVSALEWPAVRGRVRFLRDREAGLAGSQRSFLRRELDLFINDIAEYIAKPQQCYDTLRLVALRDVSPVIATWKIGIYGEVPDGSFVPVSLDQIPSASDAEAIAYASMDELLASRQAANDAGIMASYNRLAARDYARTYSSQTTQRHCGFYPVGVYQDTHYYNPAYTWYCQVDCANFVSQALSAGGIPTDSTWAKDTNAWVNVGQLCDYMTTTKGYWQKVTVGTCVAGYPIRTSSGHIVLMTYNDGVTRKYTAHTNDHMDANWSYGDPPLPTDYPFYYSVIY